MNPELPAEAPIRGPKTEGRRVGWRGVVLGCWRGFRHSVRLGYALVLLVVYFFFHLHQIGLPQFIQRDLSERLKGRGVIVSYSRLRFQLIQGVVADNVIVRLREGSPGQFLYFDQVRLRLHWPFLWSRGQPPVRQITLLGGQAALPVEGAPGESGALMRLTSFAGVVELGDEDEWRLVELSGHLNHVELQAMGNVRHLSRLLRVVAGSTPAPSVPGASPKPPRLELKSRRLAQVLLELDRFRFQEPPHVELTFTVDGAALEHSFLQFRFGTAGAVGPYGEFDGVRLSVDLRRAQAADGGLRGGITLHSDAVKTPWGAFESLHWDGSVLLPPSQAIPPHLDWRLTARSLERSGMKLGLIRARGVTEATNQVAPPPSDQPSRALARFHAGGRSGYHTQLEVHAADFRAPWGSGTNANLDVHFWNPERQWLPAAVDWSLKAGATRFREASVESLQLRGSVLPVQPLQRLPLGGPWRSLAPWRFQVESSLTQWRHPRSPALESLACLADWEDGKLTLSHAVVKVPGSQLQLSGKMDALSRQVFLDLQGDLGLRSLEGMLSASDWSQITHMGILPTNRVVVDFNAGGELPPWDTAADQWLPELRSRMALQGGFRANPLVLEDFTTGLEARLGVASEHVSVDSLRVVESSGELNLHGELDIASGQFEAQMDSRINPLTFRPLIRGPALGRQLDLITLASPPEILARVRGNIRKLEEIDFRAAVAITNATYVREPVTELRTTLSYTNREITFVGVDVRQGEYWAKAPLLRYDMKTQLLHFTNTTAHFDLPSLARMIGPKTADALGPYHFPKPPQVEMEGTIPVSSEVDGDVTFHARASEFEWWYFRFTNLVATVQWKGDFLSIRDVDSGFYGGKMNAQIGVDLTQSKNTKFQVETRFADVQVNALMEDLVSRTNKLGGLLSGELTIEEGQSRKGLPWKGRGQAQIRDGVLWGLPLFGMLSPVFDAVAPGMGEAKFNAGSGQFVLTNNVVHFSKVELASSAMQLDLRGGVDFDGNLDLTLEGRPLRSVPVLGVFLDVVLAPLTKLFEYELKGTLGHPTADLKNVPSFLLAPLRPFKTLKSMMGVPASPSTKP